MKLLSTLLLILATAFPSLAATTWPASTNGNNTFYGNNMFIKPIQGNAGGLTNLPKADLPFNASNSGLIVEGNSIMAGAGHLFATLTSSFGWGVRFGAISNFAISGSTLVDSMNRWPTNGAVAVAAMKALGLTNLFYLFGDGANDISVDNTTWTQNWSNHVRQVQSSNVQVIANTIMIQSNSIVWSNWANKNEYIRLSNLPEYLSDWADLFSEVTTNWFVDGTHPTSDGYYRIAKDIDSRVRGPKFVARSVKADLPYSANSGLTIPYPVTFTGTRLAMASTVTNTGSFWASGLFTSYYSQPTAFYAPYGGFFMGGAVTNAIPLGKLAIGKSGVDSCVLEVSGNISNTGAFMCSGFVEPFQANNLAVYMPYGGFYSGGAVTNYVAGKIIINATPANFVSASDGLMISGLNIRTTGGGNLLVSGYVQATNFLALATNYLAANFVPVQGLIKFCPSNNACYMVTMGSTNLISAGQ